MNFSFPSITRKTLKTYHFNFMRFLKNKSGAVAIEFALVSLPFLIVLFAIIETGYVLLTQMIVEGATADASRQVRVGTVQQSADPLTQFRDTLCENTFALVTCADLVVDVQTFATFPDVDALPPVPEDNAVPPTFDASTPGRIVLVRVGYQWDWITPLLQAQVTPGGQRFIASAIFRVEPFEGALD